MTRNRKANYIHIGIRQHLNNSTYTDYNLKIKTGKASPEDFEAIIPADAEIILGGKDSDYEMRYLRQLASIIAFSESESDKEQDIGIWDFLDALVDHVRPQIVGSLSCPAFYLPADRTGVMHAHSVVVSSLIDRSAMAGILPTARQPMLSGVLADFPEQLIELGSHNSSRRRWLSEDIEKHAVQIEKSILSGSVMIESTEISSYSRFGYKPEGWDNHSLPLMNASSMASELAPVVLYLRHLVRPRNVLIVEEPEAHLHPELQVEFTRQLASLVQSGVKVIITTHSDWLLEELANIVCRSEIMAKQKAPSINDIALRPDQVGAWLFRKKKRPKGSVVEELILDNETGLYPTDYDVVSEALYNKSVEISRHIKMKGVYPLTASTSQIHLMLSLKPWGSSPQIRYRMHRQIAKVAVGFSSSLF